jgi:hypothetical protein
MHAAIPQGATLRWLRFPGAERYSGLGRTTLTKLYTWWHPRTGRRRSRLSMGVCLRLLGKTWSAAYEP